MHAGMPKAIRPFMVAWVVPQNCKKKFLVLGAIIKSNFGGCRASAIQRK